MAIKFLDTNNPEDRARLTLQQAESRRNVLRERIALLSWGLANEFRSGPVDMFAKRSQFIAQAPKEVQDAWAATATGPDAIHQPSHRLNVALLVNPDEALKALPELVKAFERAEQDVVTARAAWRATWK